MADNSNRKSRISRREFLRAAGGLAGLSLAAACAPSAPAPAPTTAPAAAAAAPAKVSEVKIGCMIPLTGGSGEVGQQVKPAYQLAADIINAEGGIKSMGGAKLTLVFGDSGSKPDIGVSQTERMITVDKVSLITGAYNSAVTFPATEVSERYKIPWIVQGSTRDDITDRGFKYLFRPCYKASGAAQTHFDAQKAIFKETGVTVKNAALVYEATDWPMSAVAAMKKINTASGANYNWVVEEGFPADTTDVTSAVLKVKAAKPDMLWFLFYTPQALLLLKGLQEQNVNPILWSSGGSTSEPSFFKSAGAISDYLITEDEFEIGILNAKTWAKPDNEKFKAMAGTGGEPFSAFSAQGYSNMFIIADALERAGSADSEKLRAALAATKITTAQEGKGPGRALIMPYDGIEFDATGQNPFAGPAMCQVINKGTAKNIVWPMSSRAAGVKVTLPPPDWSKRG